MKGRALFVSLVALLFGGLVFMFVQFRDPGVRVGVRKAEASCKEKAPTCLPKLTFMDMDGGVLPPDSLAGKVVVINIWATWCGPCKAEIPELIRLNRAYKDKGVVLLGVLADNASDASVAAFVREHKLDYPVVRADDEILAAFEYPEALPTTFVYDRSGHARWQRPGAIEADQLGQVLDQLLAE